MRSIALALMLTALLGYPGRTAADSVTCAQARDIIAEVERLYASGAPDHAAILGKLALARNLCSSLGDAWKYSYCSALALGQQREVQIYRDRALFNGVSDLTCPAGGGGKPIAREEVHAPGPVHAKYAFIVGVGHFRDPKIPTLQFPAKDARDLAAVLTDPRYGRFDPANVVLLTDERATRANILNSLQKLFERVEEDDLVLVFVSSHGSPRQGERGLGGVGYIVTYDTAFDSIWVDGLEYENLSKKVSLLKARRKVIFLDTCFSGQAPRPGEKALFIEPSGVGAGTAKLFLSGEGTYVITSSKDNERSFESEDLQNGYFTHFLTRALRKEGDPPTLKEIFGSLSRDVPAAVSRDKGQPQHPQMLPANEPGDLRIGVAPLAGAGEAGARTPGTP